MNRRKFNDGWEVSVHATFEGEAIIIIIIIIICVLQNLAVLQKKFMG